MQTAELPLILLDSWMQTEDKMHSKIYRLKEKETSGLSMEYLATFAFTAATFLEKI